MNPNVPTQPAQAESLAQQQQASPKKKINFKKIFTIFIVGSFLGGFIAGGYFLGTKQNSFFSGNQHKIISIPTQSAPNPSPQTKSNLVGGECRYKPYAGVCKITNVDISREIISFKFSPSIRPMNLKETWANASGEASLLSKVFQENPSYLNLSCLKGISSIKLDDLNKCNVKVNSSFDCILNLIINGTCTPSAFDFSKREL